MGRRHLSFCCVACVFLIPLLPRMVHTRLTSFVVLAACCASTYAVRTAKESQEAALSAEESQEVQSEGYNCYGIDACKRKAAAMGLKLGGGGFGFKGNYPVKGCYTYKSGSWSKSAYYGTVKGKELSSYSQLNAVGSKVRIQPMGSHCWR